jgi:C-terminal processing protease CtpA/Prc
VITWNKLSLVAAVWLTGLVFTPVGAAAQEKTCDPCEAQDRERAVRRYQQEIERIRRETATIERQLSSQSASDSASIRRLTERLVALTRAHARQVAQLQSLADRSRAMTLPRTPAPNEWLTEAIDGYIGVLWSASVQVDKPKNGDALWTFHDYPQVEAVERESPAERAGIEVGDMILAFDGRDLRAGKIPMNAVLRPGNTIVVRLTRENRPRSVSVKVEPRPRYARTPGGFAPEATGPIIVEVPDFGELPPTPLPATTPRAAIAPMPPVGGFTMFGAAATLGAEMIPLDETLGEPYGTDHGLLILRIGPRTPAARAGIQKGDVLISVDGRELRSVPALIRAVERAEKGELRLELLRKREKKVVVMNW